MPDTPLGAGDTPVKSAAFMELLAETDKNNRHTKLQHGCRC